jgi:hypothetical protein
MSFQKRREYLKSIYLKQFPSQNLDVSSLRSIFILYDRYIFNNQISRLVTKKISFILDEFEFYNQRILVSKDSIFYKIKKSFFENLKSEKGDSIIDDENVLIRIFILIENFIVQLIILVQGYYNILTVYEDEENIFKCQGELYQCLLKSFFGSNHLHKNLRVCIEDINIFHPLKKTIDLENVKKYINSRDNKISLLKNFSSSCYLDSLLIVLLFGDDVHIKKILLNLDISSLKYPTKKIVDGKNKIIETFINPTLAEETDTEEKTVQYTQNLQNYIRSTFIRMLNFEKGEFRCSTLRQYLIPTNPGMVTKKYEYKTFTPSEIYSTLCSLFQLLINDIPTLVDTEFKIRKMNMFMMWDFMNPHVDKSSENYIWNKLNSNFLVFQLGVYPRIYDYGSSGEERIEIIKYKDGVPKRYSKKLKKKRVFSEYILNRRYRLFGAIRNIGNIPSDPSSYGGGHYTAYLRPFFDKENWYEYDDIYPRIINLGPEIPKDIFLDEKYKRSEMFFYTKISV